jgi:GMP synthase (glutamine-hydrolysing)
VLSIKQKKKPKKPKKTLPAHRKPFMDPSFEATNAMLRFLLQGEKYATEGGFELAQEAKDKITITVKNLGVSQKLQAITGISATLVPVQTVGVQGDGRSYSYLCALSGEKNWDQLFFLAKLIPKVLLFIIYLFGGF